MSKISNALNMYFLLMSKGIMSGKDLAERLEVSPRMIAEYKNDLEMAGIYIGSRSGPGGGYYLEEGISLNSIYLTEREKDSLLMAREQIRAQNQAYADDFDILTNKILSVDQKDLNHYFKIRVKKVEDRLKEEKLLDKIRGAVIENLEVDMKYWKLGEEELELTKRKVRPYGTFYYKANIYMAAYCLEREDYRYFKLSRIEDLKLTRNKFVKDEEFSVKNLLAKSFGIYSGDLIDVKIKIKYPMSVYVKEDVFIENQEIEELDKDVIFKARLGGLEEVETWVLGMGEFAEVIEPVDLRDKIRERLNKARDQY